MLCTVHRRLTTFTCSDSGGGVGGLTLAVALSKYPDIEVEVFEAAKQFTEIGAGVGIWPRAFKVQMLPKLIDHTLTVLYASGFAEVGHRYRACPRERSDRLRVDRRIR